MAAEVDQLGELAIVPRTELERLRRHAAEMDGLREMAERLAKKIEIFEEISEALRYDREFRYVIETLRYVRDGS